MTERRYDDDEVTEILARATRDRAQAPGSQAVPGAHRTGMSLPELQEIGREVGIDPTRIEHAALELDRGTSVEPVRTFLGAPRSVSRAAPLPRPLDDEEWERLVAELRRTFGATGKAASVGSLRTWSNGNLQAHVEPDGDDWRLRLHTLKGNASVAGGTAAFFALLGVLMVLLGIFTGPNSSQVVVGSIFALFGAGQIGFTRLTLPGWADERARQMEQVLERAPKLLKE